MAGLKLSSPMGCDPTRQRCGNSVISTAAKWANGRTTGLKIRTCHSDDESGRCSDFVARQRYKNSSRFTLRFTTISTRNAISSIVNFTRYNARLRWPSGNLLRPEFGHFRPSCANRRRVAIKLTAPRAGIGATTAITQSQSFSLDITTRTACSARGIFILADAAGVSLDQVAIISDMPNYLPMFARAGLLIAKRPRRFGSAPIS